MTAHKGVANAVLSPFNKSNQLKEQLTTQCEKMLFHDYTRRHNVVVRCIHLSFYRRYGIKALLRVRSHSVQEVVPNENVEIRVNARMHTMPLPTWAKLFAVITSHGEGINLLKEYNGMIINNKFT
ncbi:hypothetical protein PAPHI01_2575 [Pancytospora philotis]|nr:hypothetical protein PAPHI01_2575 [Pancytospora philotis]